MIDQMLNALALGVTRVYTGATRKKLSGVLQLNEYLLEIHLNIMLLTWYFSDSSALLPLPSQPLVPTP